MSRQHTAPGASAAIGAALYGLATRAVRRLPRDMSLTSAATLATLDRTGPRRITDLAAVEGVTQPAMTALVRVMEESGLVGIATYVMRGKQQLGCLRVREGVIVLEKMFFADEIRPTKELKPRKQAVGKQELELALDLVERFRGSFEPAKYEDTYRSALLAVIDRKRKGKGVHVEPREEREEPTDLLSALRASVESHSRGARKRGRGNGSLDDLSKAELEKRARKAGIPGRSSMTKDELVEALSAA